MKSLGVNSFTHAYSGIPNFNVVHGAPRDLMHVELEGTLKTHLYGLLYLAFKWSWFTMHQFNSAIRTWPFPPGKRPDILHKKPEGVHTLVVPA